MCATAVGSTFSHNPVPGERKSGMPEGTEMPAPVSATTERAPRISSASRTSAGFTRPGADRSLAREMRRAFAEERGDALARVGARECLRERTLLGLDARVEIARGRHALDLPGRQRRLAGELARPLHRGVEQFVILDETV